MPEIRLARPVNLCRQSQKEDRQGEVLVLEQGCHRRIKGVRQLRKVFSCVSMFSITMRELKKATLTIEIQSEFLYEIIQLCRFFARRW